MSGRIEWREDPIGYWHAKCFACGEAWSYAGPDERAAIDKGHECQGTPALRAASALAEALLAPGNEMVSVFAAHGGGDKDPTRWTVAWAKGQDSDRLRAWLDEEADPS